MDSDWSVLDGGYVGAYWRIRLNRSCAAAMCLMSTYFDHLLTLQFVCLVLWADISAELLRVCPARCSFNQLCSFTHGE